VKISAYDLRLHSLLRRCLRGDYVSPARDALTPAMRAGMLQSLPTTLVGERCRCRDAICRSFKTQTRPNDGIGLFTVRFHVNGELHVTCDAQGTIFEVEWLRDEARVERSTKCYALTAEGWEERGIADG
jgi:hypothetical protein